MADKTSKFLALADCNNAFDTLCEICSPATVLRLGRTCRLAHFAMRDYMDRVFDINKHLKRFFSYPLSFRVMQAQTGAIVSGSSALQFMGRMVYPQSDLDIFVAIRNAQEVCDWIVYHGGKGYRFTPTDRQVARGILDVATALEIHGCNDQYEHNPIATEDWNFYCKNKRAVLNFMSEDDERCVQVIVTHNTPMECVLSFHSTVVMNLITYCAAYSLYPKATFEQGLMLPCDAREVHHESGLWKYRMRGWESANQDSVAPPLSDPKKHTFVLGKRCVGDESTWIIPLRGVSSVLKYANNPLLKSMDPMSFNTFSLARNVERDSIEMQFSILKPDYFLGRYTACMEVLPKIEFWFGIIERLESTLEIRDGSEDRITWDTILASWNAALMEKCKCYATEAHYQYHACPAFISMFSHFASEASFAFPMHPISPDE
ncbi:hypothetical protein ACEPAG_2465 [Sanghuangporus baumii]